MTKQIADQAKTHGIPDDQVITKILLKESAVKRLVEPEEVGAGGLAGITGCWHGYGSFVHDGWRMECALKATAVPRAVGRP